jgi:cytochrome c oxidase subunit I
VSVVAAPRPAGGALGVVSTDHKVLARHIAIAAFAFFAAGGILALLMRSELAEPGLQIVGKDTYNQLFTVHGSTMIYLFVTPIALALGLYFVPLHVGASNIAAPRAALAGFWLFISGGAMMYAGFLTDQGAGKAGWFSYPPLSSSPWTIGSGMDLWILAVICALVAEILWGACILATIVRRRAPGMALLHMSVFTWSELVSALMVVFAFPAAVLAMALLFADRHGGAIFGSVGSQITYQHLFWFYGHPVVYVMFFPFTAIALEVIAVFSGRPMFGYKAFVLSILAFAAMSMAVWGHHMFATGHVENKYFSMTSTALLIPAGIEYFDAGATLLGGVLRMRVAMLFAIAFFVQFLVGGLSGIFVAAPPLDYHVTDSYVVVGHFHYTLFAGSVFGLFAGVYYWFPKVTGALLREGMGKVHFWLMALGTNLTFLPMLWLGERGMSRRVADYPRFDGWQTANTIETVGAYLIALSLVVFALNVVVSLRRRREAGDDPWQAHTLEWATTSPPPRHNFDALPPVRSHAPLHDLREAEQPA